MDPVDRDSGFSSALELEPTGDPEAMESVLGSTCGRESTGRLIGNSRLREADRETKPGGPAVAAISL